jgi:hypothetical protein
MRFWRVVEPEFFAAPFWLLPFQGEGDIWGDFSQGVALCYGLFAPLGRVGFGDAFWRSRCRQLPTLFIKKAQRSVAHLTLPCNVNRPRCRLSHTRDLILFLQVNVLDSALVVIYDSLSDFFWGQGDRFMLI